MRVDGPVLTFGHFASIRVFSDHFLPATAAVSRCLVSASDYELTYPIKINDNPRVKVHALGVNWRYQIGLLSFNNAIPV